MTWNCDGWAMSPGVPGILILSTRNIMLMMLVTPEHLMINDVHGVSLMLVTLIHIMLMMFCNTRVSLMAWDSYQWYHSRKMDINEQRLMEDQGTRVSDCSYTTS